MADEGGGRVPAGRAQGSSLPTTRVFSISGPRDARHLSLGLGLSDDSDLIGRARCGNRRHVRLHTCFREHGEFAQ